MTKKSSARLQRDAVAKEMKSNPQVEADANWDKLIEIYETSAQALVVNHENVLNLFKIPGLIQNIPNYNIASKALNGMHSDVENFSTELVEIRKMHAERTGACTSDNDRMDLFQVFEKYYDYDQRYNAIILPTILELTEQATSARTKMAESIDAAAVEKAQKELIDPTVISDIAVKEIN